MRQLNNIFLLSLVFVSFSSIRSQSIDTVSIFKNKSAIGYSSYWKEWFIPKRFLYKKNYTYSYSLGSKFTHQDSLVMGHKIPIYYKVYNEHNRLIMEGQTAGTSEELGGEIKYFYKNGKLKRVEKWGDGIMQDSCEHGLIQMHDAPGPEGIWVYYRKDGSIEKTNEYLIKPFKQKGTTTCHWVAQTIKYCQKGVKGKIRIKDLEVID